VKRSGPRKDPNSPVSWEEVWWWAADIQKRWGYWTNITIGQPTDTNKSELFSVCVTLTILSVQDPRLDSKVQKWRTIDGVRVTVQQTALQLLVELHRSLDSEELERERAALVQGAMF